MITRWQTARGQVTLDQSVRRGKFGHRTRLGGSAGFLVVFHELVPVRGEHERNVVELADAVTLALLQAVFGRASFALGFENGERNRHECLRHRVNQMNIVCLNGGIFLVNNPAGM